MERVTLMTALGAIPVLALAPMPAIAQTACDTAGADVAAIKEVSAAIDHAFAAGDAAALAALVTDDAVWMPPEEPTVSGRAAVEARYADLFSGLRNRFTDVAHSLEVVEVRVCGNWAMSRGRYRLALTLPTVPQPIAITGKNVHTYLRQPDGSWLIASDIWNSDAPARRRPDQ
jgi:uncharacterized protein (TIGR02246 family)